MEIGDVTEFKPEWILCEWLQSSKLWWCQRPGLLSHIGWGQGRLDQVLRYQGMIFECLKSEDR